MILWLIIRLRFVDDIRLRISSCLVVDGRHKGDKTDHHHSRRRLSISMSYSHPESSDSSHNNIMVGLYLVGNGIWDPLSLGKRSVVK